MSQKVTARNWAVAFWLYSILLQCRFSPQKLNLSFEKASLSGKSLPWLFVFLIA